VTRAEEIAAGLARVRERIAAAERAAGRAPGSVRLVAVSKKMTVEDVRAALAAGQRDLGESYGQELRDKRQALEGDSLRPRWHFIGPLQANKVKYVAGHVALIHSVDSAELIEELESRGAAPGPGTEQAGPQACLVQVNVSGEARKRGVAPAELPALLDRFAACHHVRCDGFMTVPPLADDPTEARPHFANLRALRDAEAARARPNVELRELSMGMSHDLEVAVAEGATFVRVGTAIFGTR
jgi:pyridoxal phosphate enzyme (YggS family)